MPYVICQTPLRRSPVLRCTAVLLAGFLLAGFAYVPIVQEIASFLIVEDSLAPAAAIISLGGEGKPPFREIEAARLYRAGWAPLVVIVRGARHQDVQRFQDLGNDARQSWELSREALMREGVPPYAILLLKDNPQNTLEELQIAFRAFSSKDEPVILVTSTFHTRRARLTWEYVTKGRSRAIVRAVVRDSFDPTRWWQQRGFAWSVAHEYLGLINYYAGFPIPGSREG
jgi:uncharacterized SAM-binding protein YcdF (DUF218 family)